MRRAQTSAEQRLWMAPRRDALGVRFRRQHPIGPYVADFACFTRKIVVEVDGATHGSSAERAHDAKRSGYLERCGWLILRVTNADVYERLDDVLDAIARAVHDAAPPPPSAPRG